MELNNLEQSLKNIPVPLKFEKYDEESCKLY